MQVWVLHIRYDEPYYGERTYVHGVYVSALAAFNAAEKLLAEDRNAKEYWARPYDLL